MNIFVFSLLTGKGIKHVQVYAADISTAARYMPILTADYCPGQIVTKDTIKTAAPDSWVTFQPEQPREDPTAEIF